MIEGLEESNEIIFNEFGCNQFNVIRYKYEFKYVYVLQIILMTWSKQYFVSRFLNTLNIIIMI